MLVMFLKDAMKKSTAARIVEARNIPADGSILGLFPRPAKADWDPRLVAGQFSQQKPNLLARRHSFAAKPGYGDKHPPADPVQ
jgi:hypothetical protein